VERTDRFDGTITATVRYSGWKPPADEIVEGLTDFFGPYRDDELPYIRQIRLDARAAPTRRNLVLAIGVSYALFVGLVLAVYGLILTYDHRFWLGVGLAVVGAALAGVAASWIVRLLRREVQRERDSVIYSKP
jgi:hypothetical protein